MVRYVLLILDLFINHILAPCSHFWSPEAFYLKWPNVSMCGRWYNHHIHGKVFLSAHLSDNYRTW